MKLIAIMGGGDWTDASVEHLEIPDDMDIEDMAVKHREWYRNEYVPKLGMDDCPKYMGLSDLLKLHGASETDTIEEFWEY